MADEITKNTACRFKHHRSNQCAYYRVEVRNMAVGHQLKQQRKGQCGKQYRQYFEGHNAE